jgi:hypothetical protein
MSPSPLAGCRGVMAKPFLEKIGFREFASQLGFPSEGVRGIKRNGVNYEILITYKNY